MSSRHKRYANVLPRLQKLKGWFSISISFQDTPDFAAQPGCILRFWFLRFAGNRPATVLFWNPAPRILGQDPTLLANLNPTCSWPKQCQNYP